MAIWSEETGIHSVDDNYDGKCDGDDVADNTVLLWYSIVNLGDGESADIANSVVGDGTRVLDWSGGWSTCGVVGGRVVRDVDAGFSYRGGGMVQRDASISSGDTEIPGLGVCIVCGSGVGNDSAYINERMQEKVV